jgi:hypothetical protein
MDNAMSRLSLVVCADLAPDQFRPAGDQTFEVSPEIHAMYRKAVRFGHVLDRDRPPLTPALFVESLARAVRKASRFWPAPPPEAPHAS